MKSALPRYQLRLPSLLGSCQLRSCAFTAHKVPSSSLSRFYSSSQRKVVPRNSSQPPQSLNPNLQTESRHIVYKSVHLRSGISWTGVFFASTIVVIGAVATYIFSQETTDRGIDLANAPANIHNPVMTTPILEGRPGNLTPEQEEKLRQLWNSVLHLTGVTENGDVAKAEEIPTPKEATTSPEAEHKKKRFGLFRKNKETKASGAPGYDGSAKEGPDDDKYGQTKQYHETLANHSPETIRETIWTMVKHDHPDALLLRFLRARKWDVEKALVMLVSTMNWRHSEMHVDDDIMKNGESGAVASANSTDPNEKRLGNDFLAQIRMGKSFLHGTDKHGRPICVVRVRLHKQGEQCEESLERYTVYLIETARMVLSPPVDTATIIFDMTGFSMANMDYTPVKFMIKCFEANYPESLGAVLVHNAPWVFQGIWKIIRGWLDPVVAAKVHFTNNKSELEEFIHPGHILKELGGDEAWDFAYIEPVPGENEKMNDIETKNKLLEVREKLVQDFEATSEKWIRSPVGDEGSNLKNERNKLAASLKENYWQLDPYLRARSLYDRQGALQAGGKIDWYGASAAPVSTTKPADTSADDLD